MHQKQLQKKKSTQFKKKKYRRPELERKMPSSYCIIYKDNFLTDKKSTMNKCIMNIIEAKMSSVWMNRMGMIRPFWRNNILVVKHEKLPTHGYDNDAYLDAGLDDVADITTFLYKSTLPHVYE